MSKGFRPHMTDCESPAGSLQAQDGCAVVLSARDAAWLSLIAAHDGETPEAWLSKMIVVRAGQVGLQTMAHACHLSPDGEEL